MLKNRTNLILFFFIFAFSIAANLLNISIISDDPGNFPGTPLVHGSTILDPDNAWYNLQIKNYLNGDGFTIDPSDPVMSVRRTPGYPIFYGLHIIMFGEKLAHQVIPYTQSVIFALSAIAFGAVVSLITGNVLIGRILTVIYGTSVFLIGNLFYTITEAIHPAILVFSLYYLTKYIYINNKNNYKYLILASIFCALATLVRPTNGIFLGTLVLVIFIDNRANLYERLKSVFILLSTFSLLFTPWVIHNYIKIGEFVPLETYYQNHTLGGYGVKNMALYSWWSSWGSPDGIALHLKMSSDLSSIHPEKTINSFIKNTVPEDAYVGYSREDLHSALMAYQNCIQNRFDKHNGETDINLIREKWREVPLKCETEVSSIFYGFKNKIKDGDPLRYYVISPIFIRGTAYIFNSFTAAWPSLNPQDRDFTIYQFVIKGISFVMNVMLWLLSFLYFFTKRRITEKILIGSFFLASFIILIYFRHVETRYMLAAYPMMYIMATISIKYISSRFNLLKLKTYAN